MGAFGHPASLWSETAPAVPWLTEGLLNETLERLDGDKTADPDIIAEIGENLVRTYRGCRPPRDMPVVVPIVHQPLFDDRIKRFGMSGGRNSMKSWSLVAWALLEVARIGCRIGFVREFQRSMKDSSHKAVAERIELLGLTGFRVLQNTIRHRNGGEMLFMGVERNVDNVRSMENIRAFLVEEAHRITRRSITVLEPTLRKPGARSVWAWNRERRSDPVDRMFYGESSNNHVVHTSWVENPFVMPSVIGDVLADQERDPITARHVWDGEPILRSDARVFPDSSFTIADLDDLVPRRLEPLYGADWGFTRKHALVLVKLYVWNRILYVQREVYVIRAELDEVPAHFAGSSKADPPRWANPKGHPGIPEALHGQIRADSAGPAYIKYLRKLGFTRIVKATKGPNSIANGIAKLKSYDIHVHPKCVHTIDELRTHQYVIDPRTDEVTNEYEDDNNHVIDSLRYAIERVH